MYKLEVFPGENFSDVALKAKVISNEKIVLVEFEFNGVKCIVEGRDNYYNKRPNTNLDLLFRDYQTALTMGWEEVGPNCVDRYDKKTQTAIDKQKAEDEAELQKMREEHRIKQESKQKSLDEKLDDEEMSFKDKELWDKGLKNNDDPYGTGIYKYAERWAKLMQYEMNKFKTSVKDVADKASHDADVDGITGFMYGAAVSVLSHTWEHGEELRKWHNGEFNHEGDGVVNPAVLNIGKKEE